MLFSEITAWCIIVVTATVLHANGITDIKTAADAAKAIEPLLHTFPHAGYLAEVVFAIGIIGLGLLSIPILAASAAYVFSATFNLPSGLNYKFKRAKGFYGIIIFSSFVGLLLNFIGINPMKALVYAAILNGIVAVPIIFIVGLVARNEKIMGKYKSGLWSEIFVWLTFIFMLVAAIAMFFTI